MQRAVGYIFLIGIGAAGVITIAHRADRPSALNPFGEAPDWLGIALIATALAAGVWMVVGAGRRGRRHGGGRDSDESGTGAPGAQP